MKTNRYLLGLALLVAGTLPAFSQVSNDNEDEVYKIDARAGQNDFVPGQVLVKFKDESPVNVSRTRGMFSSVNKSAVDAVLKEFGVETMDKLLPNAKPLQTRRKTRAFNGEMIEEKDLSQIYLVKTKSLRKDSTIQLVKKLKELGEVEYAEPNYKVYIMGQAPNSPVQQQFSQPRARTRAYTTETSDEVICADPSGNPLYSEQWGLEYEGLPELWKKPIINKKRPVIAILDTGVDITHPDLVDNIWTKPGTDDVHGYDFINNTTEIRDYNMHGTHVAGIAAACNNETGIVGANPQALIMPVTVMQSDGTGDAATIAQGIDYAVENGATVINLSLGFYANSNVLRQALANAYHSAVIVAAAGNDKTGIYKECVYGRPMYPAAYEFVFGVQAMTETGSRAIWSNFDCDGPTFSQPNKDEWNTDGGNVNYEMLIPGCNIIGCIPNGNYKKLNGTSMATPLLAGGISALQMVKDYGTQEILWGDIIHSETIAKAYNITERPAMLEFVSFELDDKTDGGNGDGQPDAGETLRFYPIIKTVWGKAENIELNIEVGEFEDQNLIEVQTNNIEFGSTLSAFSKARSINPIIVKIKENVSDSRHIRLVLKATCDKSSQDIAYEFPIIVNNIVKIGGALLSDMTLTADKNYLLATDMAIPEGVTLTIEPGTVIKCVGNINCVGKIVANGEPGKMIVFTKQDQKEAWEGIKCTDTFKYCIFEYVWDYLPFVENSILRRCYVSENTNGCGTRINVENFGKFSFISRMYGSGYSSKSNYFNNYINNNFEGSYSYTGIRNCNFFNNRSIYGDKSIGYYSNTLSIVKSEEPSYYGSASESIIRQNTIFDYSDEPGMGLIDMSNILTRPVAEAHGIVWKVEVDGYDAQDEYEQLPPLGVGKHKFEVYFNRPMNKEKAPQISFGVREPYTQNVVAEDGSWNDEGTIYTAYVTITGKTQSDGINRIYVYGAEDDEFFECPYEKTRFNINVQSAGSQSTGFSGEAGLGRVELDWNELKTDMTDVLGFNVYRYTTTPDDSVRVNDVTIDAAETHFTDYDVVPGTTYYYKYKVQSTDLQEFQTSNVVAVTPQTAKLGDVTGNNEVDVFDIVYEVNYILGKKPKAFVKCAADVNSDNVIDVLDVQGIIKTILDPSAASRTRSEAAAPSAVYTIEDGVLYVESPVALGGVQVQVNVPEKTDITTLDDLKGFEQAGSWLSKNDYLFMAYNMKGKTLAPGKHALLRIGDGDVTSITVGDANGVKMSISGGDGTTAIDNMATAVKTQKGIYNLKGQKVAGSADEFRNLPKGIYIVDGIKVLK